MGSSGSCIQIFQFRQDSCHFVMNVLVLLFSVSYVSMVQASPTSLLLAKNWDLFWNGNKPHLTPCFQKSVLTILPCAILLILNLFKLCGSWTQRPNFKAAYSCTVLYIGKLIFSIFLVLITLGQFIYLCYLKKAEITFVPLINYFAAVIRLIGLFIALGMQIYQRRNGVLNSKRLFIFWFMESVCGFITSPSFNLFAGTLERSDDKVLFILGSMSYPIYVAQMFLSVFSDPDYRLLYRVEMDEYVIEHQPVLSRLFFSWMNRLILFGKKNTIKIENIDHLSPIRKSVQIIELFQKWWSREVKKLPSSLTSSSKMEVSGDGNHVVSRIQKRRSGKPSLFRALARAMAPILIISILLELTFDLLDMLPALLLDLLISFAEDVREPLWHGVVYAICLFIVSMTCMFVVVHNWFVVVSAAFIPKVGLTAAIYRKTLKLSSSARLQYTVGELCNLIAVDTQNIFDLLWFINLIWSAPLRIILIMFLLWQYLGVACLAGMAVLLLIMPITMYIASKTHGLQDRQMKRKDSRLKYMGEILNGIKVLKLFAWEMPFMSQISDIRKEEVSTIRNLALLNSTAIFLWSTAPFLVTISSFVTYLLMDENNVLDPSIVFVSLTLFNRLRTALTLIPDIIAEIVQSRVSFQRVQKFLLCDEINEDDIGHNVPKGKSLVTDNASFSWTVAEKETPFLRDITMDIPDGALVAIVGKVGSGKSALLSAFLGEMHISAGQVNIKPGTIAYVAQQAWIQNASLQNNVLFLKAMNSSKYNDILDKCSLRDDLEILPYGDQTEIGEKGVNLSGGQKQRVSIARALYQDSDMYLLDDPLSAVDSHVGAHIFNNVIGPNGVLKNKTRILVTHDLRTLPEMDLIIVMVNGRIAEMGNYRELMDNESEFSRFVEVHLRTIKDDNDEDIEVNPNGCETLGDLPNIPKSPVGSHSTAELREQIKRAESRISRTLSQQEPEVLKKQQKRKEQFIEKEKMEEGTVKSSVFITYFRNASFHLIIFMLASYISYQGFEVGANVWLSKWSTDDSNDVQTRNLRIGIYGVLGIGQGASILLAAFLLAISSTRASRRLHAMILKSILRSPMAFFEKTPVGRILNRFGSDVQVVDSNLPLIINRLLSCLVSICATVIVISSNSPSLFLIMLPFFLICVIIQRYFISSTRQVRRIQSVTFSPIMSNFSETVQGTSTIRAFQAQQFFIKKEDDLVDTNSRAFFCTSLLNRWLAVRLETLTNMLILIVALFFVLGRESYDAGTTGLTLTYTLSASSVIALFIRFYTNLEIRMVSVERIVEYSELPSEAPWEFEDKHTPSDVWPTKGEISFENYQLKYQKSPNPVLRGLNVNIMDKEKVGIVGRTGAGKSSLTVGLFRILEAHGGSIRIDGIDISTLGLHDLRRQLTIIPQDPVLFSGTLRMNLDPLSEHTDVKLWTALDHAHLKDFVSGLDSGLEHEISEGGENVSVGQRQQICLARALLKKTRILILDEATAAVDMETDSLIQETIRREFNDCTVLTIAHRLYTILDYDRILVMDNGVIAEEGKPDVLLQNQNSMFFNFAKDARLF